MSSDGSYPLKLSTTLILEIGWLNKDREPEHLNRPSF